MMRSVGHYKGQKCRLLHSQRAGMVQRELLYLALCPGRLGFMLLAPTLLLGYYPCLGRELRKPCPVHSAAGERCKNVIKVTSRVPGCG